jgi:cytochrome b-561
MASGMKGEAEPLLLSMEAASSLSPLITSAADRGDNEQPLPNHAVVSSSSPFLSSPQQQQQQQPSSQQIQFRWVMAAYMLSFIAVLLVFWWIHMLGGFSWQTTGHSKQVFNWHPFLMVIAFDFITVATLSFRTNLGNVSVPNSDSTAQVHLDHQSQVELHNQQKLIHGMAWLIAALCAIFALLAVFQSHNDPVSGYSANLYSLHSWMGMMVILFYVIQFGIGFFAFWKPIPYFTTTIRKQRILQIHKTVGPIIYYTITLTILLGIQEKETFVVCSYPVVDKPDWVFPFSNLSRIPVACRISHVLAFVILFTAICTSMALGQHGDTDDRRISGQPTDNPMLSSERDQAE